ncbi:hypothetical protein [Devosia faecipullorum]|uniref:hypothetical protein n=1 Tax=Devosia faecipullorum TaxID=2755039 RepID=UPI00187B1A3D|nr:hypothetical protein [Devosia faecipullorum]MBE7733519.1 hypothetical protein [Devosia faecipullorum]
MTWRYSKDKLVEPGRVVPAFITMQPEPDESLAGLFNRMFGRTVFSNFSAAAARAGIASNRPDFMASSELTDAQVEGLAARLGTSTDEVRFRLHPPARIGDNGTRGVNFHGQFLRLTFLERERRRVSPMALELNRYHRALWDVRPLSFDSSTMELLLDTCPVCGNKLRWRNLFGPEKCDHCRDGRGLPCTDLRDHRQPMVPEEQHDVLRAVAGLLDPRAEVREQSVRFFPDPWRGLAPSEIFHLLTEMGLATSGLSGTLLPSSLPLHADALYEAGRVLAGGVEAFHAWSDSTLTRKDAPHWTVDRPMASTGYDRLVKCPHISLSAKSLLQGMRLDIRKVTRRRRAGSFAWLVAWDLTREFHVDHARTRTFVKHVKSVIRAGGDLSSEKIPKTKEEFASLIPVIKDAVSIGLAASMLRAGMDVVDGIGKIGLLQPIQSPASLLLKANTSYSGSAVRQLMEQFQSRLGRSTEGDDLCPVATVLRNSGIRPLPRAAAWHLIWSGAAHVLCSRPDPSDWLREVLVPDPAAFIALLHDHPSVRTDVALPDQVTTQVAAQMIDSDIVVVAQLVKNKILSPSAKTRPLMFRRKDVEQFAEKYVSTPELKRALGWAKGGPLSASCPDLPPSAFDFAGQRSRFYLRSDCTGILQA